MVQAPTSDAKETSDAAKTRVRPKAEAQGPTSSRSARPPAHNAPLLTASNGSHSPGLAPQKPPGGNQALLRHLEHRRQTHPPRLTIQKKLAVGSPNDASEREADHIADRVMRIVGPASPLLPPSGPPPTRGASIIQRKCASCEGEEKTVLQRKPVATPPAPSAVPSSVHAVLRSPGRPLDPAARAFFEPRFGRDFSQVRVHTDSPAAASARDLHALAYTAGEHVVFNSGQYTPRSQSGAHLIAHELAHVVQQTTGGAPQGIVRRRLKYDDPDTLDPAYPAAWSWLGSRDLSTPFWQKPFQATLNAAPEAALETEKGLKNTPKPATDEERERTVTQIRTLIRLNALGLMASNRSAVENKRNELVASAKPSAGSSQKDASAASAKAIRTAASQAVLLNQKKEVLEGSERRMRLESTTLLRAGGDSFEDALAFLIKETNPYQSPAIVQYVNAILNSLLQRGSADRGLKTSIVFNMGRYLADWRHRQIGGIIVSLDQVYEQFPFLAQLAPEDVPQTGAATDSELMSKVSVAYNQLLLKIDTAIAKIGASDIDPFDLPEAVAQTRNSLSPDLKAVLEQAITHHHVVQFWKDIGWTFAQVFVAFIPVVGPALAFSIGVGQLASAVDELVTRYQVSEASTNPEGTTLGVGPPSRLELALLGVQIALTAADLGGLAKELGAARTHGPEAHPHSTAEGEAGMGPKGGGGEEGHPGGKSDAEKKGLEAGENDRPAQRGESAEKPTKPNSETERISGESSETLENLGGEARVSKDGFCKICRSPCQKELDMVREALANARTKGVKGYLENLLKRVQLLDDAMGEARLRGALTAEYQSRFRASFNKLSNEVDAAYLELVQRKKVKAPALREIERFEAADEGGFGGRTYDPERALEGTAYHDRIQTALTNSLPQGTVFTENTIQAFFASKKIVSPKVPKISTGIDVYVIDTVSKRVVAVDITGVAGGSRHVEKLVGNVETVRGLFEQAGLHMTEPIEIEYVGQTFDEASRNIINELKPFAR